MMYHKPLFLHPAKEQLTALIYEKVHLLLLPCIKQINWFFSQRNFTLACVRAVGSKSRLADCSTQKWKLECKKFDSCSQLKCKCKTFWLCKTATSCKTDKVRKWQKKKALWAPSKNVVNENDQMSIFVNKKAWEWKLKLQFHCWKTARW